MCCLFGMVDVKRSLPTAEKVRIISTLGKASEARGTDATGYAYNSQGRLQIVKQPLPARRMRFRVPQDAFVIMGHTRMTTQGSAKKGRNNHPFFGHCVNGQFALAHNGVLSNDTVLRKTHKLPHTKIETDSYVAVQLLEKRQQLGIDSIRHMAEAVKGTFTFTILDRENRLYFVKGNNPLCLYHFPKKGLYIYASTKAILDQAVRELGYGSGAHEEVDVGSGEILVIDSAGTTNRAYFQPPISEYGYSALDFWLPAKDVDTGYRRFVMDFANTLGIKKEIDYLCSMGFSVGELEECVYDKDYRTLCLLETGYYEEAEGEYCDNDCFENLAWA